MLQLFSKKQREHQKVGAFHGEWQTYGTAAEPFVEPNTLATPGAMRLLQQAPGENLQITNALMWSATGTETGFLIPVPVVIRDDPLYAFRLPESDGIYPATLLSGESGGGLLKLKSIHDEKKSWLLSTDDFAPVLHSSTKCNR